MKPLKSCFFFSKAFGKVECVWCQVIKCDSSPAERALTLSLVGFCAVVDQELAVPRRLEVLDVPTHCKGCCAGVCACARRASWQGC